MTGETTFNVLFLCTGNSARSILAESILNRAGGGKFRAFSAGSMPTGVVNRYATDLLEQMNFETDELRSKNWEEFDRSGAPDLDFVFTVCDNAANEVCPVWPGRPVSAHWGVPDPAAVDGSDVEIAAAFARTFNMLSDRISAFVNLPLHVIDRRTLQRRFDEIGEIRMPEVPGCPAAVTRGRQ